MKACFICETPYQIFNVINFVTNQVEYDFNQTVLYIGEKFNDARQVCDRILKTGIFDSVEMYSYAEENNNFFLKEFYRYAYVIFPRRFLKRALFKPSKSSIVSDYDIIFVSTLTRFGMATIMLNSKAKICYYDDGLATYQGRVGSACITPKRKLVYRMLGRDFSHLYPEDIYVNNKAIYHSEWNAVVKSLPSLSKTDSLLNSRLKYVFNEPIKEYSNLNIILLLQPSIVPKKVFTNEDDAVCRCLKNTKYILRPHPREMIEPTSQGCVIDNSGSLWELVCLDHIDENSILIAKCSTAQVTPKLLYDREPYLIFTHYLYDEDPKQYHDFCHDMFLSAKRLYKKKNKVIEVSDAKQLKEVLDCLPSNRLQNNE